MKGAIIMPAGCGKTTLSTKYKELYDIDSFHTLEDIDKLNKMYKEVEISNNWEKYNKYEVSLIEKKLNNLQEPFILLVHCKEKAELLKLTNIGSCKISKKLIENIAYERGKTCKLREQQTLNNWAHTHTDIFDSHKKIEKYIIELCKTHNIILTILV